MPSSPAGVSEPGLALLRERLQSIPDLLEGWARSPEAALAAQPRMIPRRVVATGLGSSEAHARYLVWLLNRFTDIPAEFMPTGALLSPEPGHYRDRTLVVFSQGLSAHARIALSRRSDFASTVLFTAASLEGLRRSGKQDREDCLQALLTEGAEVIRFPLEDEYTLLIRVVGPVLGFLAARIWVGAFAGNTLPGDPQTVGAEAAAAFRGGWDAGRQAWPRMEPAAFGQGFALLVSPDLSEYLQNLVFKFVEGLFRPAPDLQELISKANNSEGFGHCAARRRWNAMPPFRDWCLEPTFWSSRRRGFSLSHCSRVWSTRELIRCPGRAAVGMDRCTTTPGLRVRRCPHPRNGWVRASWAAVFRFRIPT